MGIGLEELGRPEEALAAYEEVIARFGESTNPLLMEIVAFAEVRREALDPR